MAPCITSSGSGQGTLGLSCVMHHSFQLDANSSGWGLGVAVAGLGVAVGGLGVAVGGTWVGMAVGGTGVGTAVGGTRVGTAVGGTGVGGMDVAVGSGVGGIGVSVGSSPPHAASTTRAIRNGIRTRALGLTSQACTIQLPLNPNPPMDRDGRLRTAEGGAPYNYPLTRIHRRTVCRDGRREDSGRGCRVNRRAEGVRPRQRPVQADPDDCAHHLGQVPLGRSGPRGDGRRRTWEDLGGRSPVQRLPARGDEGL